VLYGFWVANLVAFSGDAVRQLAAQFLELAEKQGTAVPLMVGHRLLATSLLCTGDITESRTHFDRALALYVPGEHRSLATRFGADIRVVILCLRSQTLWSLGYPEAALADADRAIRDARDRPSRYIDVCFILCRETPHSLRQLLSRNRTSTRFHRNVIRTGEEFGSRMRHLFALLPARNGDSGY
jgi:predicted MarR family transcription regulator